MVVFYFHLSEIDCRFTKAGHDFYSYVKIAMCGFKGFAFWREINEFPFSYSSLLYKSPELSKRGPDDRNIECQFPLVLDHYRLSIRGIDIQESVQPKKNSNYIFAFNGEIYAHSSESLQKKNVRSDTEFLWQKLNEKKLRKNS